MVGFVHVVNINKIGHKNNNNMASRYTKKIPQYVYFVGEGEWIQGPFVRPKQGFANRKFLVTEVPMDEPKVRGKKSNETKKE